MEIRHYLTEDGTDIYAAWFDSLRDIRGKVSITRRIDRMAQGNFGDHKHCRDGVWELRVDVGPGYRVYYGLDGDILVLLLCGGDKSTQTRDIARAARYWNDYLARGE